MAAIVGAAWMLAACDTLYNDPQPWCTILAATGSTQCFYRTKQQCEDRISGLGGMCIRNPEFTNDIPRPRRRRAQ